MFLRSYRLGFIGLLSSLSLFSWQSGSSGAPDLELGLANIQSVVVAPAGPARIVDGIVVRVTDSKNVQSFGVTNEAGILVMPLPPGKYCYDAFSHMGKALKLVRQPADRCFYIRRGAATTVGVGLAVQPDV